MKGVHPGARVVRRAARVTEGDDQGSGGSALVSYFAGLGDVPLLSREEEVEVARRLEGADLGIAFDRGARQKALHTLRDTTLVQRLRRDLGS